MMLISTQTGFMPLEDSEKLLRAIFPAEPGASHSAPQLEPQRVRNALQL
jgi:hypothetical protein